MTCLSFHKHVIRDQNSPKTVEDAFRFYGNFSGIHDFDFEDTLLERWQDALDGWEEESGAWSAVASASAVFGTGSMSGWNMIIYTGSADIPRDFKLTLEKNSTRGGIVFRRTDEQNYYLLHWSSSSVSFSKCSDGTLTDISVLPVVYTGQADIELAVKEERYTDYTADHYLIMTATIDGHLVLTAADQLGGTDPGRGIGLAVYSGDSDVEFANLRIPQMCPYVPWCSIDPGEAPMGGLRRAIAGRYIKYYVRWDGSLRAWVPNASPSVLTIPRSSTTRQAITRDWRRIITHIRMLGAFAMAEVYDEELYSLYGHRFEEVNNPNLYGEQDCADEGVRVIRRAHEQAKQISIVMPGGVLLELEDHVVIDSNDWIVTSMAAQLRGGKIETAMVARQYLW